MNGEIIKSWKIYQASPSKMYVPPAMDAEANDVVIETLVLTYERVEPDL
jgi:phage tail-like protein